MCCVIAVLSISLWRFHKTDWRVITASAVVPGVAMAVSFLLPWLVLKRNIRASKAIAVETAMQNLPTAIAFVVISYKGPVLGEIFPPLFFAGALGSFECILLLIVYRIVKHRRKRQFSPVQHKIGDDIHSSEEEEND